MQEKRPTETSVCPFSHCMYRALIMLQTSCHSSFNFFTHTRLSEKKTQNVAAPIVHNKKSALWTDMEFCYVTILFTVANFLFLCCVLSQVFAQTGKQLSLNGRTWIDKPMRQSINESPGGQRCLPAEGWGSRLIGMSPSGSEGAARCSQSRTAALCHTLVPFPTMR